ncbi:MAG: type IV pilus biogenesis protein PilP [Ottowia sp.]|nr:type IV pilus biogenesis protein PilP [Ottowia sp.]
MKRIQKTLILISTSLLCQAVFADISQYQELDALRSQNAVLTEAVKNAELKCRLNNGGKDCASAQIAPTQNLSVPPWGATPLRSSSPQVELVSGFDNKKTAIISVPGSGNIRAHVGKKIAGLGTVKSISVHEVTVEQGGKIISLPFAEESFPGVNNSRMR